MTTFENVKTDENLFHILYSIADSALIGDFNKTPTHFIRKVQTVLTKDL